MNILKRIFLVFCAALLLMSACLVVPELSTAEAATVTDVTTYKPAKPKVVAVNVDYVQLSFANVSGIVSNLYTHPYVVYRSTKPSSGFKAIGAYSNRIIYDVDVKPGKTYYYKIRIANSSEKLSQYSPTVAAVTLAKPFVLTTVNKSNNIKIAWPKVAGATKYKVYIKEGSGKYKAVKTLSSSKRTYTHKAKDGKKYTIYVQALAIKSGKTLQKANSATVTLTTPKKAGASTPTRTIKQGPVTIKVSSKSAVFKLKVAGMPSSFGPAATASEPSYDYTIYFTDGRYSLSVASTQFASKKVSFSGLTHGLWNHIASNNYDAEYRDMVPIKATKSGNTITWTVPASTVTRGYKVNLKNIRYVGYGILVRPIGGTATYDGDGTF